MGIGESLLYQSEFSVVATRRLRDILKRRFDEQLAAELSAIRYSVRTLHQDRPPKALDVAERRKLATLRREFERLSTVIKSLSKLPRSTRASATDSELSSNTRRAVAFAVHTALCGRGRLKDSLPKFDSRVERGRSKLLHVREKPDFFGSVSGEIDVFVEALRALERSPLAQGRPANSARDHAATSIVVTLKRWDIPVSKTRNGIAAKVIETVLLEFDLEAPEDLARLVRSSVDRANNPDWVRNLAGIGEVSPLVDD